VAELNQIQRGDLQKRLTEGLEIIGERSPAPVLATEVMAVVILEDLTLQSIVRGPVGRHAAEGALQAAVVGEMSYFELFNPAGSGVIAVIDGVSITASSVSDHVNIGWGTGVTPGVRGASFWADRRNPGAPTVLFGIGTDPAPQVSQPLAVERSGVNGGREVYPTFARAKPVLSAGESFAVQGQTANLGLAVSFSWVEYDV